MKNGHIFFILPVTYKNHISFGSSNKYFFYCLFFAFKCFCLVCVGVCFLIIEFSRLLNKKIQKKNKLQINSFNTNTSPKPNYYGIFNNDKKKSWQHCLFLFSNFLLLHCLLYLLIRYIYIIMHITYTFFLFFFYDIYL